ncbi:ABC transporter ATP-binding protein [Amylibacter sp. SFDW26]|uniref:ABC transporter ATP-binding protein n=1 Tax=Amylibacter sp. SFDW26 TaxID=2652722 RepID=UPI001261F15A|nr:ABC transporter ATP-binding protein [Amylibacter sp. SFDW26]KAB7616342.1 ABC transporter ATP-binding protein [Amylibacter sp. SFDW26]
MSSIISVQDLSKEYDNGFKALKNINLEIEQGEVIALLGPNGAGKTTLISIICGLVSPTSGQVLVGGNNVIKDYRKARSMIGLVPQEIALEPFQSVMNGMKFTRGLFGKRPDAELMKDILMRLSLWDKRDAKTMELSGGMKRRVLIAKALCHEPAVLFLDEPTAGVDVELRKDMWAVIEQLKAEGVTIILTTHYIEEAEAIADRVGIIRKGDLLLVEQKETLMQRMGQRQMVIELSEPIIAIPKNLKPFNLEYSSEDLTLTYSYEASGERTGIASLFTELSNAKIILRDVQTHQSSLEDIFVDLIGDKS